MDVQKLLFNICPRLSSMMKSNFSLLKSSIVLNVLHFAIYILWDESVESELNN